MGYSDLFVLHRYFIWSNKMRILFDKSLREKRPQDVDPIGWFADNPGIFMSDWYGGLYVVIEGYRQLKCTDPKIDVLLRSPNVELLRRYRNGSFHFQKSYFDEIFLGFISETGTVGWVRELHEAFSNYFLQGS
jgi:hypothetical protein